TYYAAWALDSGAEDGELASSVDKSYVNDASRKVCGEAIQVHGGIGFTWEFDLHLYFKRAKALAPLYGDAEPHRELIVRRGAGWSASGAAPTWSWRTCGGRWRTAPAWAPPRCARSPRAWSSARRRHWRRPGRTWTDADSARCSGAWPASWRCRASAGRRST